MDATLHDKSRLALLIEDDVDHQQVASDALEAAGFRVAVCSSLHDSIEFLAADHEVAVVVVDLGLPDNSGPHTVEAVRSVTQAPVVVYSAAEQRTGLASIAAGAQRFVPKTAPADLLTKAVTSAVGDAPEVHEMPGAGTHLIGVDDFVTLAQRTVDVLAETGLVTTWLVTRVVGDDWVVLASRDETFGICAGDVLSWRDSICSRMVRDLGPRIEPDVVANEIYLDAPITRRIDIGCYVGLPLVLADGTLFGTLCGIGSGAHADPPALLAQEPVYELIAQTLASAINADIEAARLSRRLEVADAAATRDALTGLGNRRAWDRAVLDEEERCERFGHRAGVVVVDLDGLKVVNDTRGHAAGDELLRQLAHALDEHTRAVDTAFRLGGDEFAVLLPEVDEGDVDVIVARLRRALSAAGIAASIGSAERRTGTTLVEATELADAEMYREKRSRS